MISQESGCRCQAARDRRGAPGHLLGNLLASRLPGGLALGSGRLPGPATCRPRVIESLIYCLPDGEEREQMRSTSVEFNPGERAGFWVSKGKSSLDGVGADSPKRSSTQSKQMPGLPGPMHLSHQTRSALLLITHMTVAHHGQRGHHSYYFMPLGCSGRSR